MLASFLWHSSKPWNKTDITKSVAKEKKTFKLTLLPQYCLPYCHKVYPLLWLAFYLCTKVHLIYGSIFLSSITCYRVTIHDVIEAALSPWNIHWFWTNPFSRWIELKKTFWLNKEKTLDSKGSAIG